MDVSGKLSLGKRVDLYFVSGTNVPSYDCEYVRNGGTGKVINFSPRAARSGLPLEENRERCIVSSTDIASQNGNALGSSVVQS